MESIQVTGTVKSPNLFTSSIDVGLERKPSLFTLTEDGTVSESIEEDTELLTVSVTEFMVLLPISSEVKVTTVDVEIPELSLQEETEDITDNIQDTGTVKSLLNQDLTSEDVT